MIRCHRSPSATLKGVKETGALFSSDCRFDTDRFSVTLVVLFVSPSKRGVHFSAAFEELPRTALFIRCMLNHDGIFRKVHGPAGNEKRLDFPNSFRHRVQVVPKRNG
ncbi:MAG: hypothetical protein AVO39_02835 [delta proteobacterium MLS_D]|nr:MAG: hypothetical protein AVO39_02835 [delta proteobacterium MLS_D]